MVTYIADDEYLTGDELPDEITDLAPQKMVCDECDKNVNIPSIRPEMVTNCCGCDYHALYKRDIVDSIT